MLKVEFFKLKNINKTNISKTCLFYISTFIILIKHIVKFYVFIIRSPKVTELKLQASESI
jgi:hypothetical protein